MEYNVFDTEHEAVYAQAYDFNAWKESISPSIVDDAYWNLTNKWSDVKQRITDGKWVYNLCPEGLQTHTQETYDDSWFFTGD